VTSISLRSMVEIRTVCGCCGEIRAPWFEDLEEALDAELGHTYQAWLDTPCETCGMTPRQTANH
jgi:hypothetical protein